MIIQKRNSSIFAPATISRQYNTNGNYNGQKSNYKAAPFLPFIGSLQTVAGGGSFFFSFLKSSDK